MKDFTLAAQTVQEAVDRQVMPGAALAFGQEGQLLFCRAFGQATLLPQPQSVSVDTLFDLASLTKVLATTLLAARLVSQDHLDLDAPLGRLLPSYYPADKADLPLRLILVHTAGLPAHVPFCQHLPPEPADPAVQRRQVLDLVLGTPLAYTPGSETRYSDLGFILLGDLLEQLEGSRLDHLCEERLFGPLGLADTFFVHLDQPLPKAHRPATAFAATEQCSWRNRLVRGQVHDENAYLLRGVAGHAGLFSTAGDLQTLARQLLSAMAGTSAALPSAALRTFACRQELVPGSSRALGWDTPSTGASCGHRFSPRAFGHTGFTGTSVWLDPEKERFVVLLSNRVHPTRENTAFLEFRPRLHDVVLEQMDAA